MNRKKIEYEYSSKMLRSEFRKRGKVNDYGNVNWFILLGRKLSKLFRKGFVMIE